MTSFEKTLGAAERFTDAAAVVCEEATRLGAQHAFVVLLDEIGDDQKHLAWIADSLRARVVPASPPYVAPLVGSSGWFGAVICEGLHVLDRELGMLATHLSVWCTEHGMGAAPKLPAPDSLGPRQHQIAELAARGLRNDEIANELGISVNTVKTRLKEVFEILDVRNRTELVHVLQLLARRAG
jgi:DNA-binding CsgD family transcriptional regulator